MTLPPKCSKRMFIGGYTREFKNSQSAVKLLVERNNIFDLQASQVFKRYILINKTNRINMCLK